MSIDEPLKFPPLPPESWTEGPEKCHDCGASMHGCAELDLFLCFDCGRKWSALEYFTWQNGK